MNIATTTYKQIQGWSWLKRILGAVALLGFLSSSFLYLTPQGTNIRMFLANTVIETQHRDWAWIFVGAKKRDEMINAMGLMSDANAKEPQDLSAITIRKHEGQLTKVEDISGHGWVGKKMYVYDPRALRVVVPNTVGQGERITSMVQRTGAVAGVNGGGFDDPQGLGNGFAPVGVIMSGGKILYTGVDGTVPQHVVAFTKEGKLVIGKYPIDQLLQMHVTDAVSFYPRVIANGKALPIEGDGLNPRTAIGQRADGVIILVVIDGRQPPYSIGATLKEVQDLLLAEGCINAGFLDGGASSEMVVNGQLITKPSSKYGERRLPSALLVFEHPDKIQVPNIWDGLTKIDPGGAYDNPDYIADIQKQHANKPKSTSTPNPKASATRTPEPTQAPGAIETPSPSPEGSMTPSPSVTPSVKPTVSPTPAVTPTGTPSVSPTPGATPGETPTGTPSGKNK
ncbi:phosphodiester glycosidase family protein [Paenibacillus frigoriresistens]|uniref:phosphodiester glycosidase family protein n=1 Tax=Paenibacillus alginolyticus TaxID=59839 RepID=UPI001564B6BA|nr:phosphodiester glycosidase family protein [Paenibacillus frigoriresistens]NRF95534.1 phosphodiester glycosidase family protein [Paenibacillus frigoriresistens]